MNQNDYALNTFERFSMLESNPVHTPNFGLELSNEEPEEMLLSKAGVKIYQSIIDSILYQTCRSAATTYATLSTSPQGDAASHMSAAWHAVRHLEKRADLHMIYKKRQLRT